MSNTTTLDQGTMRLSEEELAMLRGDKGAAVQEAIEFQIQVGNFFGAERFVPITHAHVMGDIEVMGDGGLQHLRHMTDQHASCAVPASSNAQCMHFHADPRMAQDAEEEEKEKDILSRYKTMRIAATDSCIPYQHVYQPKIGEHVAWGDTGTVIYANSVLGARTNFEAGKSSFAAALTGRTPEYGFHLDAARNPPCQAAGADARLRGLGRAGQDHRASQPGLFRGSRDRRLRQDADVRRTEASRRLAGELRLDGDVPHGRRDAGSADAGGRLRRRGARRGHDRHGCRPAGRLRRLPVQGRRREHRGLLGPAAFVVRNAVALRAVRGSAAWRRA